MALQAAPAGESSVVSGSYRVTWAGLDLGTVGNQGINLRYRNTSIPITADITGETVIERINSGTNASITMVLQDWNAQGLEAMIWWMGTLKGLASYSFGDVQSVGVKQWAVAQPLVLAACNLNVTNQPGSGASPVNPTIDPLSITFFKTLLADDQDIDILFSFRPRFVTVTLDIYPVQRASGNTIIQPKGCDDMVLWEALRNDGNHLVNVPTL